MAALRHTCSGWFAGQRRRRRSQRLVAESFEAWRPSERASIAATRRSTTLSKLERAFLRLLENSGLPLPATNRPAGGRFVDCRWPSQRLTVELDGHRYHRSRHAWEQDRRREREAYARGDRFRRFTWDDVTRWAPATLAELRVVLTAL